jgi:hypothetical protein
MSRRVAAALGLLVVLCVPGEGGAQSAEVLAGQCAAAGGDATLCARAAGAGRDLSVYVGALAGPGPELAGQASTLGRRLGGPRFGAALRVGGLDATLPSLATVSGAEESRFVPSAQATFALGLFDGFGLLPTVGGLLSLDVVAAGSLLFLPADRFGGRAQTLSVGARVGILRESFTLPAVTLSVSRRFGSEIRLGDVTAGDQSHVRLVPGITSLRATIGKDLFAFGVLAGVGWDDFSAETTVRASNGSGGFTSHTDVLEGSRRTYFGGLSKQVGIFLWLAADVGWVSGFAPVSAGAGSSPQVGRSFFGSATLVLKP